MAGYVTAKSAFVRIELPAREARNICNFWKLTFCDFNSSKPLFFLDVPNKDKHS